MMRAPEKMGGPLLDTRYNYHTRILIMMDVDPMCVEPCRTLANSVVELTGIGEQIQVILSFV